jgi:hypothetical protein
MGSLNKSDFTDYFSIETMTILIVYCFGIGLCVDRKEDVFITAPSVKEGEQKTN